MATSDARHVMSQVAVERLNKAHYEISLGQELLYSTAIFGLNSVRTLTIT